MIVISANAFSLLKIGTITWGNIDLYSFYSGDYINNGSSGKCNNCDGNGCFGCSILFLFLLNPCFPMPICGELGDECVGDVVVDSDTIDISSSSPSSLMRFFDLILCLSSDFLLFLWGFSFLILSLIIYGDFIDNDEEDDEDDCYNYY